jgi:hypothetical protein
MVATWFSLKRVILFYIQIFGSERLACFLYSKWSKEFTHIISFQFKVSEVERNAVLWWCYNFPHTILVSRVQFWETGTCYCAIRDVKHTTTGIYNMRSICIIMAVQTSMCYMVEVRCNVWKIFAHWRILTHLHNACHQNEVQIQFCKNTHNLQECLHSYVHSHDSAGHIHQIL